MDIKRLQRAKELEEEIHELDCFTHVAGCVWKGKVTLKKIISSAYGMFGSEEFKMNTEIKNRVLVVLKTYMKELEDELEKI